MANKTKARKHMEQRYAHRSLNLKRDQARRQLRFATHHIRVVIEAGLINTPEYRIARNAYATAMDDMIALGFNHRDVIAITKGLLS